MLTRSTPSRRILCGIAGTVGVWHDAAASKLNASGAARVIHHSRAFDDCLRRVRAGKHVVSLCIDHGDRHPLCDTRDGLKIWQDDGELVFRLEPTTRRGEIALKAAEVAIASGRFECSLGTIAHTVRNDDGHSLVVVQADIAEISLVRAAGHPNTFAMVMGATR